MVRHIRRRSHRSRNSELLDKIVQHSDALSAAAAQLARVLTEGDRTLHDMQETVLQNIYAAGLGLEAARGHAARDAKFVERTIRRAITQLNAVIRDMRDHAERASPRASALHKANAASSNRGFDNE